MAVSLFDHIKQITQVQDPDYWSKLSEQDKKSWSNYMVNRFLSMNEDWVDLIGALQQTTQTMKPELVYKLYINMLPKSRRFLRYVKGVKDTKYETWLVDLMTKHFEVNKNQAIDYLNIMYATDNGRINIREICESYGTDPKEIKKLKL